MPKAPLPPLKPLLDRLDVLDLSSLPDVEQRSRLLVLDTLACTIAGLAKPQPAAVAKHFAGVAPGDCVWPGSEAKLAPAEAAYVGTMAACWDEACEGLAVAHGRPGLHSVAVALIMSAALGRSLGEALAAVVGAYELGGRFGAGMVIREGMHVDGTWGLLASTAAACYALGARPDTIASALAAAACQMPSSLYSPIAAGCTVRNTYAAQASATGIHIAAAAVAGISAPSNAFGECDRLVMSNTTGDWAIFGDLDRRYLVEGYLKPYAGVRHVHYAAACAIQWRQQYADVAIEDIESVTLTIYEEAVMYCGNRAPETPIQAQFSLTHGTAYALRTGELGPDAYSIETLSDPAQQALEQKIHVVAGTAMRSRAAGLAIRANGKTRVYSVEQVLGDPEIPMDSAAVESKALQFMQPVIGAQTATELVDYVLHANLDAGLELFRASAGRQR